MTTTSQPTDSTRRALGGGFYALMDLRAFLAVSGSLQDADRALGWLTYVLNPVLHRPRNPDHSFSDLISLFVVRELLKKGVRPSDVHDAEAYLRSKWKTDRPFVSDEIQTDGRNVFVDEEPITGQIEAADMAGQQTMLVAVKDRLTHVHYHEGTAAYWTPTTNVLVDPRVQFGAPVVEGTRVPTEAVADVARQAGLEDAANRLGITPSAARSAVAFEEKLVEVRD